MGQRIDALANRWIELGGTEDELYGFAERITEAVHQEDCEEASEFLWSWIAERERPAEQELALRDLAHEFDKEFLYDRRTGE